LYNNSEEMREAERFDSHVVVTAAQAEEDTWMESSDEGLFYKVPRRIISFIEGCYPSRV
jgi:hypothetical protein